MKEKTYEGKSYEEYTKNSTGEIKLISSYRTPQQDVAYKKKLSKAQLKQLQNTVKEKVGFEEVDEYTDDCLTYKVGEKLWIGDDVAVIVSIKVHPDNDHIIKVYMNGELKELCSMSMSVVK